MSAFSSLPIAVVALGGNAISPPEGALTYAQERVALRRCADELKQLAEPVFEDRGSGSRLVIVHGNGPQVGRMLQIQNEPDCLDIHVAQTQGELGYLLMAALARAGLAGDVATLVTRAAVSEHAMAIDADKPIGPILRARPAGPARAYAAGWRQLVVSPEPQAVIEHGAIRQLLATHHVIAGGGGGVPVSASNEPLQCVIDKDWIASMLAIELGAAHLIYVTNVDGVVGADEKRIGRLSIEEAGRLVDTGVARAGSMAPKLRSAVRFVERTGLPAHVTTIGGVRPALEGCGGTMIAAR